MGNQGEMKLGNIIKLLKECLDSLKIKSPSKTLMQIGKHK